VLEVLEHVGRVRDGDRLEGGAGEGGAGVDHVDRAERQRLVDLLLVAERRGREDVDLELVGGALGDLAGRPHRLGVVGLVGLVDMGEFELGLGQDRTGEADRHDGDGRHQGTTGHHLLPGA
jgi:hypothetical protein